MENNKTKYPYKDHLNLQSNKKPLAQLKKKINLLQL